MSSGKILNEHGVVGCLYENSTQDPLILYSKNVNEEGELIAAQWITQSEVAVADEMRVVFRFGMSLDAYVLLTCSIV